MDQRIIDLYDEFTHTNVPRREFLGRLAKITGSMSAAVALVPVLANNYAHAKVVSPDDSRIDEDYVEYPGPRGPVRAYQTTPTGDGPFPGIVVIHENRGLNPHIEDVARRAATAGYFAVAPDALSPLGGTPGDEDRARTMMQELQADQTRDNFVAGVTYAAGHESSTGRVGCVGFCWGGAMANQLAVPEISQCSGIFRRIQRRLVILRPGQPGRLRELDTRRDVVAPPVSGHVFRMRVGGSEIQLLPFGHVARPPPESCTIRLQQQRPEPSSS